MSLLSKIRNWIEEPPPKFAFELAPTGLALWQQTRGISYTPTPGLDPAAEPLEFARLLADVTPAPTSAKRRPAAVILPDTAARLTLMDFDSFPRKTEEQLALIRLRLRRTVPFDIDSALIRYTITPREKSKVDVIAAAIAVETLAPLEAAFRNAGFHPGFITLASLSASNLASADSLVLRVTGSSASLAYFEDTKLRLYRFAELSEDYFTDLLNLLDPTLAFLEDEWQRRPERLEFCGLNSLSQELASHLDHHWSIPAQPLRSRLAAVEPHNAGLLGYLESAGVN